MAVRSSLPLFRFPGNTFCHENGRLLSWFRLSAVNFYSEIMRFSVLKHSSSRQKVLLCYFWA